MGRPATQRSVKSQLRAAPGPATAPVIRVAIYARKSVAAKMDERFTSLEAQLETVRSYVKSQSCKGWAAIETRFEDNGFSGANTDRPGFQELRTAIESGKVDVLAVYKLDRVSRSQADLHQFLRFLQDHDVDLVSTTENFDTTTIQGRAMIGLISTFAQMERETIAERTRDKVHASRRRGMWTGGRPVIGYGLKDKKLIVIEDEANRVQEIFRLYLELGSLGNVVRELRERNWQTKSWTSKEGRKTSSRKFTKATLHRILTNPIYLGKVTLKDELFDGEHEAIIEQDIFDRVKSQLNHNSRSKGRGIRNKWGALLGGLLHCGRCGAPMGHQYTQKPNRIYRFYVCQTALDCGAAACPGTSTSAPAIERFVVDQIRGIGQDEELCRRTFTALESRRLEAVDAVQETPYNYDSFKDVMREFTGVWDALPTLQKAQALQLLIKKVVYDPDDGSVELMIRAPGPIPSAGTEEAK
ncbi:MAG: recombinase family protein [Planctomycetes bacterium]|nr:recombinase family protein [Planctomycetota bacterium]